MLKAIPDSFQQVEVDESGSASGVSLMYCAQPCRRTKIRRESLLPSGFLSCKRRDEALHFIARMSGHSQPEETLRTRAKWATPLHQLFR
jgi:hypothetical protein